MEIKFKSFIPITDLEISAAEREIGSPLPSDYRSFLLKFDSAILEPNTFDKNLDVSVERFIPVSEIWSRAKKIDGFPMGAVPIAECSSGNFVYIKFDVPGVFFWDHEVEGELQLSDSFSEFVDSLREFDLDSIQLEPGQVRSVWVDPNFKPEFD